MTTRPSNQSHDQWSAATMAAYIPQTVSMRAAAESSAAEFAWSAEPPASVSPLPIERQRRRFMPSGALAFVGGGLVVAAVAGLFGALHAGHSTAVDTTTLTAPAPVPTPPPAPPAPAPAPRPKPVVHTSQSVTIKHQSAGSVSHPAPPTPPQDATPPPPPPPPPPPNWNRALFFYWLTHRRHDGFSHWHSN
jgi:hypothetical protein